MGISVLCVKSPAGCLTANIRSHQDITIETETTTTGYSQDSLTGKRGIAASPLSMILKENILIVCYVIYQALFRLVARDSATPPERIEDVTC